MNCKQYQISDLVLERLAVGEIRVLSLTVAVRRGLPHQIHFKGDLANVVRSALRKLVAEHRVVERDGMYALLRP